MKYLPEVRAAIVKAVPEIEDCEVNTRYGSGKLQKIEGWEPRPIRLADVLRAIVAAAPANRTLITLESSGQFVYKELVGTELVAYLGPIWNLAADNLADQSPETIAFLHSILCV